MPATSSNSSQNIEFAQLNHGRVKVPASSAWKLSCIMPVPPSVRINTSTIRRLVAELVLVRPWTASAIADGRDPASCTADLQALGLTEPDPVVLAAAALLRAPEPFRRRRSHWSEHTRDLLACALGASS